MTDYKKKFIALAKMALNVSNLIIPKEVYSMADSEVLEKFDKEFKDEFAKVYKEDELERLDPSSYSQTNSLRK